MSLRGGDGRVLPKVFREEGLVHVPTADVSGVAGPEVDDGPVVGAQHDNLARFPTDLHGGQAHGGLVHRVHRHVHHLARRQVRDVQPLVIHHGTARGHVHRVHLGQSHVHDVPSAARTHRHVHLERTVTAHVVHDNVAQPGVRHVHELATGGRVAVHHD